MGFRRNVTQIRCMSNIVTPSSRRSRAANPAAKAEFEEAKEKDEKVWDIDFDAEVMLILNQVNEAVIPMINLNPGFEVIFDDSVPILLIVTAKGKLTLTADKERGLINLQSFLSGVQHYYFDPEERNWLSSRDQHNLRGIVTRDLIRHNRGMPNLDEKS